MQESRMNQLIQESVTDIKVRLLRKCLINCSCLLRKAGLWLRPRNCGVVTTPSTGGRATTPSTGGRAQGPRGGTVPFLGAGLVISYLRPSGRVSARSSSRVYARYNSVRLLGRTTRRPAPSSYECPVRRRAALFVSAARLTNVPVLCARRAISSQSSAQGQVNRSVHHHHRSESREVF